MKTALQRLIPLLIAVCLPSTAAFAQSDCSFTILHTNDLHAHDDPYVERGHSIGGMDRIAHLMRVLRAQIANVVTVDAGDIFQGTPFFKFYHGAVEVEMLNQAGYDVYTIGNHEFDDGPENLAKQLAKAKFSIISCNLDASSYPQLAQLIKPAVVKTIAGQKVAFIGAIVPDFKRMTLHSEKCTAINADGDWMAPIREQIAKAKSEGINKIILVTHTGVELDRQLAQLPDVDAIIGGHSHTRLNDALVIDHPDGSHCVIVQTGCYGKTIGKLDLAFTPDGKLDLSRMHYRLINITDRIKPDKTISRYLKEKAAPFESMRKEIVAYAKGDFDNAFRRYPGDSPLGDLITDALYEGVKDQGATVVVHNRGGIRARIDKGPVSAEKVEEVLPFENHLILATVTGADLLKVLENSVGGTATNNIMLSAKFLDVHGLKYEWDPTRPPHHRIKNVSVAGTDGQYHPLDVHGEYRVAVNSYTFGGGEGYDFSRATNVKDTGKRLSLYLHDYLKTHKNVTPQTSARIVPTSVPGPEKP